MIRKTIAVLLTCAILLSCVSGICESNDSLIAFDCPFTLNFCSEENISQLLDSSIHRAALTVSLLMDFSIYGDPGYLADHTDIFTNESYVCYSNQRYTVLCYSEARILLLNYYPDDKTAAYKYIDSGLSADFTSTITFAAAEKYDYHFENDLSEVLYILNQIEEELDSSK